MGVKTTERNIDNKPKKGVSLAKTNFVLAILALVISAVLLITTFQVNTTHKKLNLISKEHIEWQQVTIDMESASNYLTEECRAFVVSGKDENLEHYFWEARTNRRREKAVDKIRERFSEDSEIYQKLRSSLEESYNLMNTEYYAMRLYLYAYKKDTEELLDKYPELKTVELSESVRDANWKDQLDMAQQAVNNAYYRDKKDRIEKGVTDCMTELIGNTSNAQKAVTDDMSMILTLQRIWIALLIGIMLVIILTVMYQIINPLRKAVPKIRNDEPLLVSGAAEFRLLATTYNRMYQANQAYRERLMFKASHDPLTGVLNRSGMEEMLSGADLTNTAVLIVDVDHFKRFNDEYGHEMGDKVLVMVARELRKMFRTEDVICRMGGDEFSVVMWHVGPERKSLIEEKIRRGNEELGNGIDGLPPIWLSVGVAFGSQGDPAELYHHADAALYRAKNSGRRCCAFYEEEQAPKAEEKG